MGLVRKARERERRWAWRLPRIDWFPYLLVGPAVIAILSLVIYPLIYGLSLSFTNMDFTRFMSTEYVGLENYRRAFSDKVFVGSIWRTVRYVGLVGACQMLLSIPVALLLNGKFVGRGALRSAIVVPWVTQSAVTSIMFRGMVDPNFGIVNDMLRRLGLIQESLPWMAEPALALLVVMVASLWAGFSFFAITLLGVLQAIPDDLYEAARVDGAGAWQQFRYVTFPIILPTILLLLLIRSIGLAHGVELIFLLTQGGPVYYNYTIAIYSFIRLWRMYEVGYPTAIAYMLSVVLLALSVLYIRSIERSREWM